MGHDDFAEFAMFVALMIVAPYIIGITLMAAAAAFVAIWLWAFGGNDDNA